MSNKFKADVFAAEIKITLDKYASDVTEAVKEAAVKSAEICRDEIKRTAPKKTGEYRKGWKIKTTFESVDGKTVTVYNDKRYELAHLLEFGHRKENGTSDAPPHPHIYPAAAKAQEEFEKMIKKEAQ